MLRIILSFCVSFGFLGSLQASALETLTVFGFDKTSSDPAKPRPMDRLVERFNTQYSAQYGFKVAYSNEGGLIEQAIKLGADLLDGSDVIQIKDIVHLGAAKDAGFFESLQSPVLEKNIPAHLRAKDGTWFAMTKRARIIYYNTDHVKASDLSSYEALTNPQWNHKLCLRMSGKTYNKALGAFFMDQLGQASAVSLFEGLGKNNPIITAVDMSGKTADQLGVIEAVDKGICHVGVANTYYFGFYAEDHPYHKVKAFFPNQNSYGTHINVTSFGVNKSSHKKAQAQAFIEWLSLEETQSFLAPYTHKYPTNTNATPSAFLESLGGFVENKSFDLEKASSLVEKAYKAMVKAGWADQATPVKGMK